MLLAGLGVGLALGVVIGALWVRTRPVATAAVEQRAADHALVREGPERCCAVLCTHTRMSRARNRGCTTVDVTGTSATTPDNGTRSTQHGSLVG